jgi:hypothetical protein
MGGVGGTFQIEIIQVKLIFNYLNDLLPPMYCLLNLSNVADGILEVKTYEAPRYFFGLNLSILRIFDHKGPSEHLSLGVEYFNMELLKSVSSLAISSASDFIVADILMSAAIFENKLRSEYIMGEAKITAV